jgi:hypothetical protein
MEGDGFGTLFLQQDTHTNDEIVLSYLDLIMWVCNVVH